MLILLTRIYNHRHVFSLESLLVLQRMKKAALIFLVFMYAFSTTGLCLQGFYCCGKLKSVKLTLADYAKDKEGCCKIKYQAFKVTDTHAAADIASVPPVHSSEIQMAPAVSNRIEPANDVNHHNFYIHAPPLRPHNPIYIENCVFRI